MRLKYFTLPLLVAFAILFLYNCEKEEMPGETTPDPQPGSAEIEVDSGSIGLVIDVRPIAKKGYVPVKANVEFSDDYEKFSRELSIHQNIYVSVLKLYVDSIQPQEKAGFGNGVAIVISVYDESNTLLGIYSSNNQVIDASDKQVAVMTELPSKRPLVKLTTGNAYLIQSEETGEVLTTKSIPVIGFPPYPRGVFIDDYDISGNVYQKFYFEHVPGESDSSYYIMSDEGYVFTRGTTFFRSTTVYGSGTLTDNHIFIVTADEDGWVKIRPKSGTYLELDTVTYTSNGSFVESGGADFSRFRLLNGDLTWSITDLGTIYEQPILPAAKLEFAYKATLSNCSPATLTEKVGRNETRTITYTSGSEESLQLFTSHEASVEVTAGVEVEAKFFGKGADYNFEVTAGYTYTTSTTSTSTSYWESTETKELEISRERELQVGPNLAVEVYDAVETIRDVQLPFTKKFRLRAQDNDGSYISGEDLNFQLFTNQFGGVIHEIGDDFVDITIKGTTTIDNMMEVDTRVTELEGSCE